MYDVVYFSNFSGNTKRFVEKLSGFSLSRIPIKWDEESPLIAENPYVLFLPTYGGGNDSHSVPKQVVKFLNVAENREKIVGVVGLGNTNFGTHYCKGAEIVSAKLDVPLLYRVEIFGTPEDVNQVTERLHKLWTTTAITN